MTAVAPYPQNNQSTPGLSIHATAEHLRNYAAAGRAALRCLTGWFLAHPVYETKYRLAYHAWDHAEHVTWLRARLEEMRGGRVNASVRPALRRVLDELPHAPDSAAFLQAMYGVYIPALLQAVEADLARLDLSANANEHRLLSRITHDLRGQLAWYAALAPTTSPCPWALYFTALLQAAGGIHEEASPLAGVVPERPHSAFFTRPTTIHFDERIARRPLMAYADRSELDASGAAVEQFRVFFNEFYAAALLASILYDAAEDGLPWDFYRDLTRHFWDEARHSEFGAIRLRELGEAPDRCDPVLYERSQGLPVLHRIAYLTRGLEAYFMPRKPKRFKEYAERGDERSQLFADQDWSDEINHVRYGSTWTEFLLKNDCRELDDVIEEVKQHLSKLTGRPVTTIDAPF